MNAGIPFFGAAREYAAQRQALLAAIDGVLQGGMVLQGDEVVAIERELARRCGRRHAVAVGSCTDALAFALVAAGVGPGDEVLVTSFSFVATASPILRVGAMPVFSDIGADFNMDLDKAADLVTDRTRALIHAHLFGHLGDPDLIEGFAREHGLALIEDAAQAFGATRRGRAAGSLGLASCLSFDPTKVLGAPGSGGAVLTDDDSFADRVRRQRYHGKHSDGRFVDLGYNSQMPSLTAAYLMAKLPLSEERHRRRARIAAAYTNVLEGSSVSAPSIPEVGEHAWHKFVVRSPQRDELRRLLAEESVPTLIHYSSPLHHQPIFSGRSRAGPTPMADDLVKEVLTLPLHAELTDDEVDHVGEALAGAVNMLR
jgi:dTDP-4-amino-4,6-dideoxygalactose transaminase